MLGILGLESGPFMTLYVRPGGLGHEMHLSPFLHQGLPRKDSTGSHKQKHRLRVRQGPALQEG